MKTIVDVVITPGAPSYVTPLELLEDFADAVPSWSYLEAESQYYAAEKHVPACVIRMADPASGDHIDFAFAAAGPSLHDALHLCVVIPSHARHPLRPERRSQYIARFVEAFRSYLSEHPHLAGIRTEEREATEQVA